MEINLNGTAEKSMKMNFGIAVEVRGYGYYNGWPKAQDAISERKKLIHVMLTNPEIQKILNHINRIHQSLIQRLLCINQG